jgi:hypothetical protein
MTISNATFMNFTEEMDQRVEYDQHLLTVGTWSNISNK